MRGSCSRYCSLLLRCPFRDMFIERTGQYIYCTDLVCDVLLCTYIVIGGTSAKASPLEFYSSIILYDARHLPFRQLCPFDTSEGSFTNIIIKIDNNIGHAGRDISLVFKEWEKFSH